MKSRISISEHSGDLGGKKVGVKKVSDADEAATSSRALPGDSLNLWWSPEPYHSDRQKSVFSRDVFHQSPGKGG